MTAKRTPDQHPNWSFQKVNNTVKPVNMKKLGKDTQIDI